MKNFISYINIFTTNQSVILLSRGMESYLGEIVVA